MNDTELKQFQDLAKKYEPGKDKEKVSKIVQDDLHEVFQDINDGGRTAANNENKTKLTAAEQARDKFKTDFERVDKQLKELDGKAPDAAALRKVHQEEVDKLENGHKQVLSSKEAEVLQANLELARERLTDRLDRLKVDREYSKTVLTQRDDVRSRLVPERTSDGKVRVRVLRKDSKELDIVPATGKDPLDHFAEELAATVDPKWKNSGVKRGSETKGTEGGAGTSNDRFEQARARAKAKGEEKTAARKEGTALERLGRR